LFAKIIVSKSFPYYFYFQIQTHSVWKKKQFRMINNVIWLVVSFVFFNPQNLKRDSKVKFIRFTLKILWDYSLFIFISVFYSGRRPNLHTILQTKLKIQNYKSIFCIQSILIQWDDQVCTNLSSIIKRSQISNTSVIFKVLKNVLFQNNSDSPSIFLIFCVTLHLTPVRN
jgi:hypothetical protein